MTVTKIRTIVAATDFSPGAVVAVERAVVLAQAHGAALHLVHAFDVHAWRSLRGVFDIHRLTSDPPQDLQMRQRLVDQAANLATRSGLKVEVHFGVGTPEKVIDVYAKAHKASLIVFGARAELGVLGVGGTAAKLVGLPACPVMMVRSGNIRPHDNVMSAVDLRDVSLRAAGFAVVLMPLAHHHLVFAVDPALDRALWLGGLGQVDDIGLRESIRRRAIRELEQRVLDMAAQARLPIEVEVIDDVPARGLVVRAWSLPADCVVVGHHGQGSIEESLLGNMAQHLMHHTTCDALIVP